MDTGAPVNHEPLLIRFVQYCVVSMVTVCKETVFLMGVKSEHMLNDVQTSPKTICNKHPKWMGVVAAHASGLQDWTPSGERNVLLDVRMSAVMRR